MEAKLGIPTVALITKPFRDLVQENALKKGMPNLRVTYVPSPVWGKNAERLRQDLEGKSPVTGKLVMEEIIAHLTSPLSEEDRNTRTIEQSAGPASFGPDTQDNLQKLFMDKRMTDYLPIVMPTEEKVAAMLKGTSHTPDEVVGKMAATPGVFEAWSYTVRTVAVNAVMAGAKPEYFPVILAIAAAGTESISSSDNSWLVDNFLYISGLCAEADISCCVRTILSYASWLFINDSFTFSIIVVGNLSMAVNGLSGSGNKGSPGFLTSGSFG